MSYNNTVLQGMKLLAVIALFLISTLICAEDLEIDLSQFGTPIELPANPTDEKTRPETALNREIEAFFAKHEAYGVRLINNSAGRALNEDGRLIGAEAMGRVVNPTNVIIIARASVARPVVEFYTSINKLPDCSESVCIWYTESPDHSESSLLGYTIENPRGVYTKFVEFGGKNPWLDWITASFEKDDRKLSVADEPAADPKAKTK